MECVGVCKPRYQKLVDKIYPRDANTEGLVISNMDRLTFFAIESPDKLDRIGAYLLKRSIHHIDKGKTNKMKVAIEALDILLVTCHAQSLNLFVESFLRMIYKLLESDDMVLHCLASASFVKFSNIHEDTPSYHRRYDFFISEFALIAHDTKSVGPSRDKHRVAGLRGLQAVVRKTVSDDLQCNIWRPAHMNKIIPALLFNMQSAQSSLITDGVITICNTGQDSSAQNEQDPAHVAEYVFRDLVCRASYGNIDAVIQPVLLHLDKHRLWVPNDFAIRCFKMMMFSAQAQYGYIVVRMLMIHLDINFINNAKIKTSIVDVLSQAAPISAGGSIGPSVLDVFNTLLHHLRISVDGRYESPGRSKADDPADELLLQESIMKAICEFANNLPDYQKIEVMIFIISKVPQLSSDDNKYPTEVVPSPPPDLLLQKMLLMLLVKISSNYQMLFLGSALPPALLEPLLKMAKSPDPEIRCIVQDILHALIDRHRNYAKVLNLNISQNVVKRWALEVQMSPPRQDLMFMRQNGALLYSTLIEIIQEPTNKVENYQGVCTTMCLLSIELGGGGDEEILLDQLRVALAIQSIALSSSHSISHILAMHSLVAIYLNLLSQLASIPRLRKHVSHVIRTRRVNAPHLLPDIGFFCAEELCFSVSLEGLLPSCLFDIQMIGKALGQQYDVSRLSVPFTVHSSSFGVSLDEVSIDMSDVTTPSIESTDSNPVLTNQISYDISFESMKAVMKTNSRTKELNRVLQKKIFDTFHTGPFEAIVARVNEAAEVRYLNRSSEIRNKPTDLDKTLIEGSGQKVGFENEENDEDNRNIVSLEQLTYPDPFYPFAY